MAISSQGYMKRAIPTSGKREMTMVEFKQWMKKFDTDGDGRISKEELRQALRSVGGWFTGWNSGRGVRSADGNGNGFIDDEEIQNLVSFAEKKLGVKIVTC